MYVVGYFCADLCIIGFLFLLSLAGLWLKESHTKCMALRGYVMLGLFSLFKEKWEISSQSSET